MIKDIRISIGIVLLICITSCKKFVDIPGPYTDIAKSDLFASDATASAAIYDIYAQMGNAPSYTNGVLSSSLSFRAGLSADELFLYSKTLEYIQFYNNDLLPNLAVINNVLWSAPYRHIYRANSILEGIGESKTLSPGLSKRLEGEAKFLRAFSYFYLVNMFGGVPLVLTTDYEKNAVISRSSIDEVFKQIIKDCSESVELLDSSYLAANNTITVDRFRANKFAAMALLARSYLYTGDWENAERTSGMVINYVSQYSLQPLSSVFLKNSKEAIWQLGRDDGNSRDAGTFVLTTTPTNAALNNALVGSFESKDQRSVNWIGSVTVGTNVYYFPSKYKVTALTPITEASTVLRLAEQYLIRAEARINLPGRISEGISDLNILRQRASLPIPNNLIPLALSLTKEQAMAALEAERNHELFTEFGHRWFDLKRWRSTISPGDNTLSRADDILKPIKTTWKKEDKLYPIPQEQINNDPAMANQQNPGYN